MHKLAPNQDSLNCLVKDSQDYLLPKSQLCDMVNSTLTPLVHAKRSQEWHILSGFVSIIYLNWNAMIEEDDPSPPKDNLEDQKGSEVLVSLIQSLKYSQRGLSKGTQPSLSPVVNPRTMLWRLGAMPAF